jgi:hypothetical protein
MDGTRVPNTATAANSRSGPRTAGDVPMVIPTLND